MSEPSGQLARRTHWATPLVTFDLGFRQFAIGLIPIISNRWWLLLIPIALGVLALRMAIWWRRTYELGDQIVVRSGVITRSEEVIAAARIQEIAIERKVRHRIFGMTRVRISAAGSSNIVLDSVSSVEAHRIETVLLEARNRARLNTAGTTLATATSTLGEPRRPGSSDGGDLSDPALTGLAPPLAPLTTLFQVSTGDLVLGGLTSSALWAAPFLLVAIASQLDEVGLASRAEDAVSGLSTMTTVIVGALVALVIAPLIGVARMVITNYGLTVRHGGGELVLSRGALGTGSTTIPLSRVVRVRHRAGIARRALGLCAIEMTTATGIVLDPGESSFAAGRGSDIPVLRAADADRLLTLILDGDVPLPATRHPRAAHRRAATRGFVRLAFPALVIGVATAIAGFAWLLPLPIAIALAVKVWSNRWFETLAHGARPGVVVARHGWLVTTFTTYCIISTTQSVSTNQSPFQRRHAVCTVALHAGRGGQTVTDVDPQQAQSIVSSFRTTLRVTDSEP